MRVPHFKFYPNDFLGGVAYLNMVERGAYITLLCYQWDSGPIPKKRLGFLLGYGWESIWSEIATKFKEDENGNIFNERLEVERLSSIQYIEKQSVNGSKGGRPKTQTKPKDKPKSYPKKKASGNGYGNDSDYDNDSFEKSEKLLNPREYLASPGGQHNMQFIHKNSALPRNEFNHLVGQFILSREEGAQEYANEKQIIAGLQKYINTASKNYHERKNGHSRKAGSAPLSREDEERLRALLESGALLGVD